MRYLVYDNPQGDDVDFVLGNDGNPRIFTDLGEAENCKDDQTNGYVIPLGWDCIDALTRLKALGDKSNAIGQGGTEPTDKEVNDLIEEGMELAKEFCDVLQQEYETTRT